MKNNKLDAVTMSGSKRKREFFNLSCDNTSTFGFGEIQPTYVHPMVADSKLVLSSETLVRLAPLNVPTFGRMSLKTYSQFVPLTDIFPCINELLAKTRYTYGNSSYVPQMVPSMRLGVLSSMCLVGADVQLWVRNNGGTTQEQWLLPTQAKWNSDYRAAFEYGFGNNYYKNSYSWSSGFFVGQSTPCIRINAILGDNLLSYLQSPAFVPIGVTDITKLFLDGNSNEPRVHMNSCDLFIEHSVHYNDTDYVFGVACNLSGFGKRIRKMLIGSGYQINVSSVTNVSLLPLFASWKAYFDLFNLPQWQNFEDTALKRLICNLISGNLTTEIQVGSSTWNIFSQFVVDVGSCWYTASQDFVSAHQANVSNSTSSYSLLGYVDVDATPTMNQNGGSPSAVGATPSGGTYSRMGYEYKETENDSFKNPHARILQPTHGQLDSELLKRLYKWTNRNSVIGQRVAELLKAQGLQDYVDSCKSNYIGSFDIPIRISDVVSQSDTYQNATDGKLLGEYGAKGIGYNETEKPLVYETKEIGYWVTLASIVPECGYAQSIDPTILSINKESFYDPEFDSLGMELNPKLLVCAQEDITIPSIDASTKGSLDDAFGFVPQKSRLKVINNKLNGDIGLRSMRNNYPAYTLDKLMYLNDKEAGSGQFATNQGWVQNQTVFNFSPATLPIAGNVWRYPTRYGWIGNLNRIFAAVGVNDKNPMAVSTTLLDEIKNPCNDNFIAQTVFNARYYAPMLKIEDSYETHDEGNEGVTTMAVNKA